MSMQNATKRELGPMMTSSNGNIFRVTGYLCGEFTGPRWISGTKASDTEIWCFLWSAPWINSWVNNGEAGDLWRYRAHYDVIVMLHPGLRYLHLAGGGSWWNLSNHLLECIPFGCSKRKIWIMEKYRRKIYLLVWFIMNVMFDVDDMEPS